MKGFFTSAIVLIPATHLLLCYLYLFFLHWGFGPELGRYAGAADIFSVNLSGVLKFYFTFGVGALFGYLFWYEKPLEVVGREEFRLASSSKSWFANAPFFIAYVGCLVALVYGLVFQTRLVSFALLIVLAPFLGYLSGYILTKNSLSVRLLIPSYFVIIGMILIPTEAYREGFHFRHKSFEYLQASSLMCDDEGTLILFPVSDKYVAMDKEGRRFLVSDDCDLVFRLPMRNVTIDLS